MPNTILSGVSIREAAFAPDDMPTNRKRAVGKHVRRRVPVRRDVFVAQSRALRNALCGLADPADKLLDDARSHLPDLRPQNIKRPDVRDRSARVGARRTASDPAVPERYRVRHASNRPASLRKWTAGSCRWRSAR